LFSPSRASNGAPPNPLAGSEGPLPARVKRGEKGRKGRKRKGRKGIREPPKIPSYNLAHKGKRKDYVFN